MDDDGRALRGIISRAFAGLIAMTHAKDEYQVIEIAERHAYWIEHGVEMPMSGAEDIAQQCLEAARNKSRKG